MPGVMRRLWRFAAGTFALVVVLLAIFVGVVRLLLVQVPEYRELVEAQAGEVLGWPVEIGEMNARLGLRGPVLGFVDARVLTQDREHTVVRAATGSMSFSPLSLFRGSLRPAGVQLEGVSLRIERDGEGRWRLQGASGPAFGETTPAFAKDGVEIPRMDDQLAGRIQLEDVQIEYEDLRRGLGPWLFRLEKLELQLGGGRLALTAEAMLPDALGGELAVSLTIEGQDERGRPRWWSAGGSFAGLDLSAVGEAVLRPELLPASGVVDGRFSAQGDRASFHLLEGEVSAQDVRPPQAPDGTIDEAAQPYGLHSKFAWTRTAAGWQVELAGLQVERGGRRWTSPTTVLVLDADEAGRRFEARADLVELDDMLPLSAWLPPETRTWVEHLAPSGMLQDFVMHLDLPADEERAPDLHVETRFANVSLTAHERVPGFSHVSGAISGDLYGGSATLEAREAEVALPWLFRQPLVLATAEVTLDWRRDEQGIALHLPHIALANEDATVTAEMVLDIPADGTSPRLGLDAVARDLRLAAGPRYLPASIMPPNVVKWLDDALLEGDISEARVSLHGPTKEFPFRNGGGEFKAEFEVTGGALDFAPDWPNVTEIDAGIRFENEGLWAEVRAARLLQLETQGAQAAIPDLAEGKLAITGIADGELAEFRELVLASELLAKLLGPGIEPASFHGGRASASIDLRLPLAKLANARARIDLEIEDGIVAYGFLGEPLRDIDALIHIDNARITARDISATLAGRPIAADVVLEDDEAVRVEARGHLDANALARVLRFPLDEWTRGEGDWNGFLRFPAPGDEGPLTMGFSSDLTGYSIGVPEPFSKTAAEPRSLEVRGSFPEPRIMDMEFEWDRSLLVVARVDLSGPEAALGAVPGGVEGEPPGLVFSGAVSRLDLGAWLAAGISGAQDARGLTPVIAGGTLLVGALSAPMVAMNDVLFELESDADRWRVKLNAERVAGQLEIPHVLYGDRPVVARLDRLWLGTERNDSPPAEEGSTVTLHPAIIPALDIEIEEFRYGDIRFGSVSARVLHEGDGIELIGLESIGDGFLIQAEGRSRLSDAVDESRLGLRIRSDNVGATLGFMGFGRSMEAREGIFEAEVRWQGGVRSDWLGAVEGDGRIMIRDGTLVNVAPGAGRVFGLLSIQALPRRLALDFKDVLGEGTAFDRISGDFQFFGGDAFTRNLVMRGPAVDMGVVGRTGLVARDYDQTAVIGADFGRTLPVAGAVVAGPAVAAALFLLSEMLRKPFQAQISYRITGPWEDPVIEKLGAGGSGPQRPAPAEPATGSTPQRGAGRG